LIIAGCGAGNACGATRNSTLDCPWTASLLSLLVILAMLGVSTTQAAPVDERLAPCLACHGASGQSVVPEVPSLGGQPPFYLSVQLLMFRERMRDIAPMPTMLTGVSDADLERMAAAIAALAPPLPTNGAADPARVERARLLIQQHRCNFCHKQDFSGEQNAARLAAQREDYLVKALREYKSNTRRAYDPSMADVMHPLTDADILDLAHYLARFR
jgi:cytochrome c553